MSRFEHRCRPSVLGARISRSIAAALLLCLLFCASACSKKLNIESGCKAGVLNEGQSCDATATCPCGSEGACVAGICRESCGSDADCSGGANCVKDIAGLGGCLLTSEQTCSKDDPCPAPLACAVDDRCRVACSSTAPCPNNDQRCLFGTCYGENESGTKPWLCGAGIEPGDLRCDDGQLEACNTTDLGWTLVASCATQALCEGGLALGGASCLPPACTAGERDCDGSLLLECEKDRTGWRELDECKTAGLCELARESGRCSTPCGDDTEPGSVRCSGAKLERCDSEALGWSTVAECASEALCDAGLALGGASCAPKVCEPGARSCNGAELLRCLDDATGFEVVEECETRGLCQAATATGACDAPCAAGGECRGAEIWLCRADGTGFDAGDTCVSAATCLPGEEPRCTSASTDVIDDFEDGDLDLLGHAGLDGNWYGFADSLAAVDFTNESVSSRGASERGLRLAVSEGGFGVSVVTTFADQVVDLTEYSGLLFWAAKQSGAASDPNALELQLRVGDVPNTPVEHGGSCPNDEECFRSFRGRIPIEFTWQAFGYTWDQLGQGVIPYLTVVSPTLATAAVRDLGFEGFANATYLIDDVTFLRASVARECESNALFCEGPVLRRCNGSGNRDSLVDVCRSDARCDVALELGHCPEACEPGAGACRGRELWRCAASGDGLEYERSCTVAEDCIPGPSARCSPEASITSFENERALLSRNAGRQGQFFGFICDSGVATLAWGSRYGLANPWAADPEPTSVTGDASRLTYLSGGEPGVATFYTGEDCGGFTVVLYRGDFTPYDASGYQGIRFRARSRSPDDVPDPWRVVVSDETTDAAAGLCGTGSYPPCYAEMGADLDDLTTSFKTYTFLWEDLEPAPQSGAATTLDPTKLGRIQWNVRQAGGSEIEIDDLEFVE